MPTTLHRLVFLSGIVVPGLLLGQSEATVRSSLRTVDVHTGRIETVFSEGLHFEAPNWSPDGLFFVLNSGGRLYRLPARGDKGLEEIPTGFATRVNNDHGFSPDGTRIALSHHAEEHITDPAQDWLASTFLLGLLRAARSRSWSTSDISHR